MNALFYLYASIQETEGIKPLCSLQITPNVKVMQIVDLGMCVSETRLYIARKFKMNMCSYYACSVYNLDQYVI